MELRWRMHELCVAFDMIKAWVRPWIRSFFQPWWCNLHTFVVKRRGLFLFCWTAFACNFELFLSHLPEERRRERERERERELQRVVGVTQSVNHHITWMIQTLESEEETHPPEPLCWTLEGKKHRAMLCLCSSFRGPLVNRMQMEFLSCTPRARVQSRKSNMPNRRPLGGWQIWFGF